MSFRTHSFFTSIIPSQRGLKLRKDHLHTSYSLSSWRLQNLAITVHCYRRTTERNRGGERDSVCHHIKGMFKGNLKWMMRKRNQRPPKNLSLSLDISSFSLSRLFLSERRALTFPVCWQICFSLRSPPLFSLSFCLLLFPLTLTARLSLSLSF